MNWRQRQKMARKTTLGSALSRLKRSPGSFPRRLKMFRARNILRCSMTVRCGNRIDKITGIG